MKVLNIYCDESGTMPINDSRDIFLAASVGLFDLHPNYQNKNGHKQWLIERLKEYNAIPFISYVFPQDGYGIKLKIKFEKMNLMARCTRLITGTNEHYLDKDGINIRNFIWSICMEQSIGNAILNALALDEIKNIKIYIDEKSFTRPAKQFFINNLFRLLPVLVDSISKFKSEIPNISNILLNRIQQIEGNIQLFWRDEEAAQIAKSGLQLAHYLSSHFRKDFYKNNESCISNLLKSIDHKYFQIDITDLLLKPINKRTIKDWEKNTGLNEPIL